MELPASFINTMRALLGEEEYEKLEAALQQEPPVSIRYNPRWEDRKSASIAGKVAWASDAYYLPSRPPFTFDPLFHAGVYYVQEASSMFVEQALRQYATRAVVMLDLCAAPGGKSTHAQSVLPEGSLLVANEVMRNRAQILAENLTKWGASDVVVTRNDPADFSAFTSFFDVILTDVPCSGEGMFRKDPVAVEEWSPENVEICWQRQRRILADIWPCLKPGGILIYSTCTYNTKEDEENVRWMRQEFGAESLPVDMPDAWNIAGNLLEGDEAPVYHFLPHRTCGEGFFLAVLRKPLTEGEADFSFSSIGKKKNKKGGKTVSLVSKEQLALAGSWLELCGEEYELSVEESVVTVFPRYYLPHLEIIKQSLHVIQAGVTVGEAKGKDFLPAHALAMSNLLKADAFFIQEVSYEQAISYLRKEAVLLPVDTPRGYVLLAYKGVPLGFVKNVGNRANNLYPQEWRIRSGYLPEESRLFFGS